jgi:hypothetical protein
MARRAGALFLFLLCCQLSGWAEDHPVFIAPGFQFDQVDTLCVMPLKVEADGKDQLAPALDALRPDLMLKVHEKGYRLLDPSCSQDSGATGAQGAKPRWVLTVSLNNFLMRMDAPNEPMGSVLTASLFDTQSSGEVWRDTARTGWWGRFANVLLDGSLLKWNRVLEAVSNDFGSVLAKFEKRTNMLPPTQSSMWQPRMLSARLVHSTACNGLLRFDSGTLSFDPSSNGKNDSKCVKFRFSVQGARFAPAVSRLIPGGGNGLTQTLMLPGMGRFGVDALPFGVANLYTNHAVMLYLYLALLSAQ